jgi:hypothetical protein
VLLLLAFIIIGSFLLVSWWVNDEINLSVLRDYKETHVSLVVSDREAFRNWITQAPGVVRYKIFSSDDNRERLGEAYPELKSVIGSLETRLFPSTVWVTVEDSDAFLKSVSKSGLGIESQLVHQPPKSLQSVLRLMTLIFSLLWVATLSLILYFNLERATLIQIQRWSLMKLLGARPHQVFLPLWRSQSIRMGFASIIAVFLARWLAGVLSSQTLGQAAHLSARLNFGFIAASLLLTSVFAYLLFYLRYKRVPLG